METADSHCVGTRDSETRANREGGKAAVVEEPLLCLVSPPPSLVAEGTVRGIFADSEPGSVVSFEFWVVTLSVCLPCYRDSRV